MNEGERTDTDSYADQHVCVAFVWQPCVVCNHIQKKHPTLFDFAF